MRIFASDADGNTISLIYFNNPGWAKRSLPMGEKRIVSGKLEPYGDEWQIIHPEVTEPGQGPEPALREPVYPLTEGLTNRRLGELASAALERAPELPEWIEPSLAGREGWRAWRTSLAGAHREPGADVARRRLAYDEIFANQLALLLLRQSARRKRTVPLAGDGRLTDRLQLPYQLTGAQRRVIEEIRGDLAQSAPMLRLLQGDVGSGKTLVALMAMLTAVESGAQAALLAPTEILARQHHATLLGQLDSLGVRVAILTGREKGRARDSVLMGLADGSIDILVGTHAIFQEKVAYKKLGLAVIDEQHRFGVSQRLLLASKAERPPHLLVMTATPIPRTLTLTQYGEMDVSRIDEMPPGRTPVETRVISDEKLPDVVNGLGRHLSAGGQAYWVCPLVEESEKTDAAAAEERSRVLKLRFGDDKVGLVHGRMKGPDKDSVMARFASGDLAVLVATTVIEVGVDVPNATLMIVEGAERFRPRPAPPTARARRARHGQERVPAGSWPKADGDFTCTARADARQQRRLPHRRGRFAAARPGRNPRYAPVGRGGVSRRHRRGRRCPRADRAKRRSVAARSRRRPCGPARAGGANLPLSVRTRPGGGADPVRLRKDF